MDGGDGKDRGNTVTEPADQPVAPRKGRSLTGFSWREEVLARVDKLVPYNVEERIQERGAHYSKALLPFVSNAVVDGRLVTGQNPGSAKETASKVAAALA